MWRQPDLRMQRQFFSMVCRRTLFFVLPLRHFIFKFTVDIGAVLKSGLIFRNSAGANSQPLPPIVMDTSIELTD
jgi:hypothetical protein